MSEVSRGTIFSLIFKTQRNRQSLSYSVELQKNGEKA
jgi:hypothetical protein